MNDTNDFNQDDQFSMLDTISHDEGDGGNWPAETGLDVAIDAASGPMTRKHRVNESILLIGGVVVLAVVALFVMRKTGAVNVDSTLGAVELKIEQALAQIGKASHIETDSDLAVDLRDTDKVVAFFAYDPAEKQVNLDNVQKNPFVLHGLPGGAQQETQPAISREEQQRQLEMQRLRDELSRFQLQTIVEGRTPMAVISGNVVKRGDELGSFKVVAIEAERVVVTVDGNFYQLTMRSPDVMAD